MRALWRVVVKEFHQLRHDRKMIPILLVAPIVQLVALGYAANMDVNDIPTLLVDQDRSPASRALVERFAGSRYFEVVGGEDTAERVEPWLVSGRAQLALVIAEGYGDEAAGGGRPRVQVIADGSDSNSAVVGMGYASRIINQAGRELEGPSVPKAAERPAGRVELATRVWYNPDLKSRWFYVPAVLAMVLLLITMILPSMAVVREKEIGTLEQIIVTPLQPWQLMIGKLVPFVLIGLVDTLIIVVLTRAVFGVPLRGSLLLLLFLTLLYLLNTLGLGLLVSTLVNSQQQAMMFCAFLLMVPMIYLSGLVFPIQNMPPLFQHASLAIPVRYYGNVLRGIFLRGSGLDVLWPEAVVLAASGALLLTLASLRFRKSLD
jgi:ABC-2 type transport system permease protein